jgi:hypothetical protein
MKSLIQKFAARTKAAVVEAVDQAKEKVLIAEGRRSLRKKGRTVAKVSRKAVRAGAIGGAVIAVGVVTREIRKRNRD